MTKMADGHRKYPVKWVIMHHSMGPEFSNSSDMNVQDRFDRDGKQRGYKGVKHSYHYHPQRDKETFSQAHYALRKYTKDKNKYGWRLTPLIKDVWHNVCWHAGNWPVNQQSIGIETCGDYTNRHLPEKALMLVADTFRSHDKKIGGKLDFRGHKEVSIRPTSCPGKIMTSDQRKKLIDMVKNPAKWNKKLWKTSTPSVSTLYKILKEQRPDVIKVYKTNVDSWWKKHGEKELLAKLKELGRNDVLKAVNKGMNLKSWYIGYGSKEYSNIWTAKKTKPKPSPSPTPTPAPRDEYIVNWQDGFDSIDLYTGNDEVTANNIFENYDDKPGHVVLFMNNAVSKVRKVFESNEDSSDIDSGSGSGSDSINVGGLFGELLELIKSIFGNK